MNNDVENLLQIEKILQELNNAFEPIGKDIEKKLKTLESITGVKEDYSFKPFTMDDITKE